MFEDFRAAEDADEHSVEMQLPYVRRALGDRDVPIVPIVVGALDKRTRAKVAALLAPFLEDPAVRARQSQRVSLAHSLAW